MDVPDLGLLSWCLIEYEFLAEIDVLLKFQHIGTTQSSEMNKSQFGLVLSQFSSIFS